MVKHCICMVSDFFYPNTGGVESHIYQLSQCLLKKGHKVIVITHMYNDRVGVRYMTSGLKVYYIPVPVFYNQATLPSVFVSFPLIRSILLREQVTIVHSHSAFSTLAHESIYHSKILGLKTVFTDHSLFGFADASAIITNKLLQITLSICNKVICVSHIGKENTALRANVNPKTIFVIPNAVDTAIFTPDISEKSTKNDDSITIVVMSRLVYRKGVDLLAELIPIICQKHPKVKFLIGGNGPKMILLEEVREKCRLQDRVTLLGAIDFDKVRDVLIQGHIFINASLTEAFCMAIVEAASCGLQVVSTNVGGIPEVLPSELVILVEPRITDLVAGTDKAIKALEDKKVLPPLERHKRIKALYRWEDVASRTEVVYNLMAKDSQESLKDLLQKIGTSGRLFGGFFMMVLTILHLMALFFEWLHPAHLIDKALCFNKKYSSKRHKNYHLEDDFIIVHPQYINPSMDKKTL